MKLCACLSHIKGRGSEEGEKAQHGKKLAIGGNNVRKSFSLGQGKRGNLGARLFVLGVSSPSSHRLNKGAQKRRKPGRKREEGDDQGETGNH